MLARDHEDIGQFARHPHRAIRIARCLRGKTNLVLDVVEDLDLAAEVLMLIVTVVPLCEMEAAGSRHISWKRYWFCYR